MRDTVEISGVRLHTDIKDHITVAVEVDGEWVDVVSERCLYDGIISHIVEPLGIRTRVEHRSTKGDDSV